MLNLTRQERIVIKFLVIFFLVGSGIYLFKGQLFEPQDDPEKTTAKVREFKRLVSEVDSVYFSQSKSIHTSSTEQTVINLNTANEDELTRISGIGPVTATKIVAYRKQNKGFKSVDELLNIKGIGNKTLEYIRDEVTIE